MNDIYPLVMVVVLSWNRLADTVECLESISHSEKCLYRVVLVDNGSSDATVSTVRRTFPWVQLLQNAHNLGYAEGNNVGIRYALEENCEYILILNNDTVVVSETINLLIKCMCENPAIGVVGPAIVSYFSPEHVYTGGKIDWSSVSGTEILQTQFEPHDVEYVPGSAMLMRSDAIRRVGLFNPDFFAYFEDTDWSLRCKTAGYRVVCNPHARVFHKGTNDQTSRKSPTTYYYYHRNQALFMRQRSSKREWIRFIRRYTHNCLQSYRILLNRGETDSAKAVLDGWWAGIVQRYGSQRIELPAWIHYILQSRTGLWIRLTSP